MNWLGEDDLVLLDDFMYNAMKGTPFRMWVDRSNVNVWSETNRTGYLDLVLLNTDFVVGLTARPWTGIGSFQVRCAVL